MKKPVIFFSHASIDKSVILPICEEVRKEARGSIEVFMSSDGSSIPFGRSWQKELELALERCHLMFVWVTPNSTRNSWLHFEAGHAYSRGIRVVPVGFLGQKLDEIPGPLPLIQGFDVSNSSQLNNIFAIANEVFQTNFQFSFSSTFLSSTSAEYLSTGLFKYFDKLRVDYYCRRDDQDTNNYVRQDWHGLIRQIFEEDEIVCSFDRDSIYGNGFSISGRCDYTPEVDVLADPLVFDQMKSSWAKITKALYGDWATSTFCTPVLNHNLDCPLSAVSIGSRLRNTEVKPKGGMFDFRGIQFPEFGDGGSPTIVIPHDFIGQIPFFDLFSLFEERGLIRQK